MPPPQPRWRDAEPFPALVSAIISQQLSGKVAAAIEARVMALIGVDGAADAERLLRTSEQDLRSAGLSRPKIGYMKGLAEHQASGEIPNNAVLRGWSDQAIVDCLTRHKGVGRWTVEMYLIFQLRRADVFPTLDLGIRRAVARLLDLGATPSPEAVVAHGEAWRPYRSVACLYLWKSLELP